MQKIAILTDSAADLTPELLKKYNIYSAPFRIIYSDKEFEDGVTITPHELFKSLDKEIPTTSLPSVEKIDSILCDLENEGYTHVIGIFISSQFSGTWNSVRLLVEDHPALTTYIFDSKTLTMAEGAIVLHAAKMINEGKSFDEIVKTLEDKRSRTETYFVIDTLEYLKRGGRIGKVAGTIAEFLNIKPLITIDPDGTFRTYAKARGKKQAISKLKEIAEEHLAKGKCNFWVMDADNKVEGDILFDTLKDLNNDNINEMHRGVIGPALGLNTGPGLIGFVVEEVI
ncbi:MAG: DegV family protein [Clostridium sp.]|nr:DegV family protein [Clostridium sp.]